MPPLTDCPLARRGLVWRVHRYDTYQHTIPYHIPNHTIHTNVNVDVRSFRSSIIDRRSHDMISYHRYVGTYRIVPAIELSHGTSAARASVQYRIVPRYNTILARTSFGRHVRRHFRALYWLLLCSVGYMIRRFTYS